ncbi:hypothetical protein [Persicitalea jodogahamensis]|uniref:Uncharacterized protein n=1 Tax=Persicitalea jodogahamensis TaxID=402147 RepID=A0A8J3G929_9BACT|nr:hypothetical protein [Persicitalea jodogahamensis]GHB59796.1 hypothetical protein GCM10007390_11880 [Persicitalea jodogahamensis]
MKQLILTLPHEHDVDWLVPMLARLGVQARPLERVISSKDEDMHRAIVEAGGDDREDFDSYLTDFEQSRQDRALPFRN